MSFGCPGVPGWPDYWSQAWEPEIAFKTAAPLCIHQTDCPGTKGHGDGCGATSQTWTGMVSVLVYSQSKSNSDKFFW